MDIEEDMGASWQDALQPDHRDLRFCTNKELQALGVIERIAQWHGISLGEARDMRGAELRRRTMSNDYGKKK